MTNFTTSVIQHPQDLVLAIMPDIEVPPMVVLQQSELLIADWRFQFAIIGESHHIRVEDGGACILHEVLACVPVARADCLHYQTFTDLAAHDYKTGEYQVQVDFGEHPRWHIPDDVQQIEYAFPPTFGQHPVTRIQWQQAKNTVHWWTLHTYAGAKHTTYVHTASAFHFGAR